MNIVIYARYSSHSQSEQSIEGQLKVCHEYARANGHIVVDEYIDRKQTGTTDTRTDFQRMILDSEKRTFEAVLVYQLDRFARNRYDSAVNKAKLKRNGIRVISARENISDDASGILVEGVLESMAEYFSVELSQKIRRGMEINAQKCLSNGSNPGLGYIVDKERRFHIDEDGAAIVREIFDLYEGGATFTEIVNTLIERGVKTSIGNEFNKNSLHRILRNRRYIGFYKHGDIEVPDGMPRIISDEQFENVQLVLDRNKKASARTRGAGEYILTTKIFCGHCKAMMIGYGGTGKSGRVYNYYICKNARKKLCDKKIIEKHWIENKIVDKCWKLLNDEAIAKIAKDVTAACAHDYNSSTLSLLRRELKAIESAIENLWKAMEQGEAIEGLRERIERRTTEKKEVEAHIAIEENRELYLSEEEIAFFLYRIKNGKNDDDFSRRGLINIFVNKIYLYDDKYTIILNVGNTKTEITEALIDDIEADNDKIAEGCSSMVAHAPPFYAAWNVVSPCIGDAIDNVIYTCYICT